jgi:hypothetical protein
VRSSPQLPALAKSPIHSASAAETDPCDCGRDGQTGSYPVVPPSRHLTKFALARPWAGELAEIPVFRAFANRQDDLSVLIGIKRKDFANRATTIRPRSTRFHLAHVSG